MLYVNDELVKRGTPAFDRFQKFKNEVLPGLSDPVIFKSGRPIKFNETGLPEPLPVSWIPYDHNVMGEEGGEHWRYCDRPPRRNKDGELKYSPRGIIMRRLWSWDKKRDVEKIFFFYEISPFVKNGKILYQDSERDAKRTLAKETADLDVRWMVTSSNSPISVKQSGSEDILRMLAAAWGVANAHTRELSIAEIQVALLSAVQESHKNYTATQRGYKEFLAEVEEQNSVSAMANVQKAIDTKTIVYDKPSFTWRFISTNTPLMTVPARDATDPKMALKKFLSLNKKSAKILELALEGSYSSDEEPEPVEKEEESDLTIEKIEGMQYHELKTTAKIVGVDTYGKQDELKKRIIDKISETLVP